MLNRLYRERVVPRRLEDVLGLFAEAALPLGPFGKLPHAAFVERDLARIFDYRRAAVARLLG
ncbi:MAG TPA: hypothetical protein VMA76_06100 [Solirubrobacteraceae bacterium]|nr:hypothetical protein [Solirubrobacteraceae bacterium]